MNITGSFEEPEKTHYTSQWHNSENSTLNFRTLLNVKCLVLVTHYKVRKKVQVRIMQLSPPMMLFCCSIYKQATSADDWSAINTAYCIASERK